MENIKCPKCNHEFEIESALQIRIESKLKEEYNKKYKELVEKTNADALAKAEAKLQEERKNLLKNLEAAQAELKEKEKILKMKLEEEIAEKQRLLEEELNKKSEQLKEAKLKEAELYKKQREFEEQKAAFESEMQKKLLEEKHLIEQQARQKAQEENILLLKEKDMKMAQLKEQIEMLKKKAEQGSMQLQGEAQELALEEILKSTFIYDTILEVGKGVQGADVIQIVRTNNGQECGSIIYESKRTKNFQQDWITKLKVDLRSKKSDIAVIVTETLPKDMTRFGLKDGIWICTFEEVKSVATVLRESLIKINEIRAIQTNKGDKMSLLYDFLTGNEFKQYIETVVESFVALKQGLEREKLAAQKSWTEREKQMEKVLLSMSGMYGSIKGIAGSAVADVKLLEFDNE
jgi:hypothetical protein